MCIYKRKFKRKKNGTYRTERVDHRHQEQQQNYESRGTKRPKTINGLFLKQKKDTKSDRVHKRKE